MLYSQGVRGLEKTAVLQQRALTCVKGKPHRCSGNRVSLWLKLSIPASCSHNNSNSPLTPVCIRKYFSAYGKI